MSNTKTRENLIELNKSFIQIPMPNLEAMTNEELERRVNLLKFAFEGVFEEDKDI